jgi:phosphomannomutase
MGLTITASHNPAQYIGMKFTVPTVAAIGQDCGPMGGLTKIREIYHSSEQFESKAGASLELLDLTQKYIDFSLQHAGVAPGDLRGLGVVLDTFHGSAGPELFRALTLAGARVEPLRLIPDGNFPTGSPNPTSQGKMKNAIALAGEKHCQAVIGIDGDGDRIVFGSSRGILTAGFAFVPILKACVAAAENPTDVSALYDPKVSPLALAEWGKLGAKPVLFRNGHSQIKDYMTRIGALAAAEESGHYYHRISLGDLTISGENSIMTVLLFLNAIQRDPGLMDRLWEMESRIFTTGEFNYQFDTDAARDRALDAVMQHFVAEGAGRVTSTPDGIDLQGTCLDRGVHLEPGHVKLSAGWYSGYLRIATNEKGVVRSYFSASDATSGKRVENAAREILERQFKGKVID